MAERWLIAEIKNDRRYYIFPWQTQNTNNDIKSLSSLESKKNKLETHMKNRKIIWLNLQATLWFDLYSQDLRWAQTVVRQPRWLEVPSTGIAVVCNGSRPQGVTGTAVLHSRLASILQTAPFKTGSDILASAKERTVSKKKLSLCKYFHFEF